MSSSRPFPRPPDFPLAPIDLQRWLRFSAKGGVGKARAKVDRISEDGEKDLMMLEGDEIVVLMDLDGYTFLGHCEGVVGLFKGEDVEFLQAKLKKPIMSPRSSSRIPPIGHKSGVVSPLVSPTPSLPYLVNSASHSSFELPPENGSHSSEYLESGKTSSKQQVKTSQAQDLEEPTRRQGCTEGLGIEVGAHGFLAQATPEPSRALRRRAPDVSLAVSSPDLAGAFQAASLGSACDSGKDATSPSSGSCSVPSSFTSPNSEDTTHSTPVTPYSVSSSTTGLPSSTVFEHLTACLPEAQSIDGSSPFVFPSSFHYHDQELVPDPSPSNDVKSETQILRFSPAASASASASNSLPGTPGDDATLSFIFDSYRYSANPSTFSSRGGKGGNTGSPIPATDSSVIEDMDRTTGDIPARLATLRSIGSNGAASELRERILRGQATSAHPAHVPPTRTLHRDHPLIDSDESYPQLTHHIPTNCSTSSPISSSVRSRDGTQQSPRAIGQSRDPGALDLGQDDDGRSKSGGPATEKFSGRLAGYHTSTPSPRQRKAQAQIGGKPENGLRIVPSALPLPSSQWRSQNDSSPVVQAMWSEIDSASEPTNVFVDSPISSQSHDQSDGSSGYPSPSRHPFGSDEQYPFRSAPSQERPAGSLDQSTTDVSDSSHSQNSSTPNKLRRKSSFRLRKIHLISHRQTSDPQDSKMPVLQNRPQIDTSKPSSVARPLVQQIVRKSSVGSKFSRKSSERVTDKAGEREKAKVDYGAGISHRDFEEETVQIGSNAFEIVKPYAALLSSEAGNPQSATPIKHRMGVSDSTPHNHRPPHNSDISTPSSQIDRSFSSHFSPPTPLSAGADEKSVEEHREKELKWIQILGSGISAVQVRKSKKIKSLVQSGIPSSVRGKVWGFLAEAGRERQNGLYAHLCSRGLGKHSAAIQHDIQALYIDHSQFAPGSAGREDLEAVLNAFTHFEPQLGYYTGLANLVALLLTQMPAEESFWTLVSLVKSYGFRQFFAAGREELRLEMIAFTFLLDMYEPAIARRLRDFGIGTLDYLCPWLSTFFLSMLPGQLPSILRMFDIFLFDPKTRYSAPLAILRIGDYADAEVFPSRDSILYYLLAPPPSAFSPSQLIPAIVNVKLSGDKVHKAVKNAAREMLSPRS